MSHENTRLEKPHTILLGKLESSFQDGIGPRAWSQTLMKSYEYLSGGEETVKLLIFTVKTLNLVPGFFF